MSQLEPSIIIHNNFKIQKSRPQPLLLECYPSLFGAASLITWITWLSYILTQIYLTRTILSGSLNSNWRIWAVLISEFLLYFQELALAIHQISTLFSPAVNQIRPHYLLIGNHTPAIDIFITCCGESPDVVLDTLNASIGQDYPAENFRVFLLDDGHDFRLRQAVAQINSDRKANNGPRIFHLSRDVPVGTRSHFKAGNLQFGIEQSKALGGSEFIAALDADMIPERDWLRRIVPHLILDDEVGLGNPPQVIELKSLVHQRKKYLLTLLQHYYNLPKSDPLGQNVQLDLIFTIYEPLSDRVGSAMCSGSGYIVRRKALENIGGWPQVDVGEDASCSGVLRSHGWKVTFVREYLQLGLAPDSFQAYIRQKWRWVCYASTALTCYSPRLKTRWI
jgi:cellulose synthase/poly-beta-1,6-N-acetylglucosamine synthase-like glycosyltransferase